MAASDRLKLRVITQGIIWLEAVTVRLLVIQTKAHRGILPALAVGAMLVFLTLMSLLTEALTVAREMPVG